MYRKAAVFFIFSLLSVGILSALSWFYFEPLQRYHAFVDSHQTRLSTLKERVVRVEEQLVELKKTAQTDGNANLFYSSDGSADIASLLQSSVRNMIIESGGILETSQALSSQFSTGMTKVSVIARGRTDEDGLHRFLDKFDTHSPIIGIELLEVQQLHAGPGRPPLGFSAVIYGFSRDAP